MTADRIDAVAPCVKCGHQVIEHDEYGCHRVDPHFCPCQEDEVSALAASSPTGDKQHAEPSLGGRHTLDRMCRMCAQDHRPPSLGERIALAIEAERNATSGRAFDTHDEFYEYREGMTTAARIAREAQ